MSDLWPNIYTRISHDLSGLSGSIFNGTELLLDDSSPEVVLMLQNATSHLIARLKFFRQTFGLQNKNDKDTTADYLSTLSIPVRLEGTPNNALERALCMVLADTLPQGGTIRLEGATLTAQGPAIKTLALSFLDKGEGELSPQTAVALFAYETAKQQQIRLAVTTADTSVQIQMKR